MVRISSRTWTLPQVESPMALIAAGSTVENAAIVLRRTLKGRSSEGRSSSNDPHHIIQTPWAQRATRLNSSRFPDYSQQLCTSSGTAPRVNVLCSWPEHSLIQLIFSLFLEEFSP